MKLPDDLARLIAGRTFVGNTVGCSSAGVYRLDGGDSPVWLKTGKTGDAELDRERDALRWLKGKAPVPDLLHFETANGMDWMLTSHMGGEMACSERSLAHPEESIRALAHGIRMLHAIDIADCPFQRGLDQVLPEARR